MKTDIIIVSSGKDGMVFDCLQSLAKCLDHNNLGTVAVAWNGNQQDKERLVSTAQSLGLSLEIEEMPYHYSKNNNELVKGHSKEDSLLFLNDDIVLKTDFIRAGLEYLEPDQDRIGTIGCKLVREDGSVQHAGVFIGVEKDGKFRGVGHRGYNQDKSQIPQVDAIVPVNTAACLMMSKRKFLEVGMFNENYKDAFQDVELSMRCMLLGATNICLNSQEQIHRESKTRSPVPMKEDLCMIRDFWNNNIPNFIKSTSPSLRGILS